jgi:Tol biopolymer transport system component
VDRPALSPDGHSIAFEWNGEKQDNWDIYVKDAEGTGFSRLTTDPARDWSPAWSPDGHEIAFLRGEGDRSSIYLVSPLGGGERKLTEGDYECCLNWSRDGKKLAYSGRESRGPYSIWSLSVDTLEKEQLISPATSTDRRPVYSPDGRYLAFVRDSPIYALFVARLPHGEPQLLRHDFPATPCWTADSREIVFVASTAGGGLWRISVDGGGPHRVPTRGENVGFPTISGNRLAYVNNRGNGDIWRLELTDDKEIEPPSKPLFSWASDDYEPCVSPDGSRIAFTSDSSGDQEIWVCNADGTKPVKLTDMKERWAGSPTWSPDGKWIAFDSVMRGNSDLFLVSAEGGLVRRITTDASDEIVPRWSRNGPWIYFGSNRNGSWQVWKVPPDGGKAIQITKEGGAFSRESVDGQFVYFYGFYALQRKGLWRVPTSGGPETLVLDKEINPHTWDLTDRGIYFVDRDTKPQETISVYDFATHRVRSLVPGHGDPSFRQGAGMSVSPDGRWLLYCGGIFTSDIMMIDNFR